jgi:hypothetical protein
MSLLARLAPHLPYMRRYARALTGSQPTGDQYVRVALEALAAGEQSSTTGCRPRVALYHVFHAIWCTSGARLEDRTPSEGHEASQRLMRIAPRSRQAFLLTALEGFTPSEAAQILDTDFAGRRAADFPGPDRDRRRTGHRRPDHRGRAGHRRRHRGPGARTRPYRGRHRRHPHRGVEAVARKAPGLVLADIQLADGSSGIDAVKDILAATTCR